MKKQVDTKSFIACIHIKDYRKFKDLIHPNITDNIDYYKKRNYYLFPTYHGFGLRNRNCIKKRVDQCVYHQVIHTGEEQKKSINKQKFIILDIKHSIIFAH